MEEFQQLQRSLPLYTEAGKGAKEATTAPYYIKQGFDVRFVFSEAITEEGIDKINEVGHWINQNVIIRLCAVLESYHIISNIIAIDFSLDGAEQVNIVRRLRNCFAHSSGKYRAHNRQHHRILELMRDKLGISIHGLSDWPLSVDKVIQPLFEGCRKYVRQKATTA